MLDARKIKPIATRTSERPGLATNRVASKTRAARESYNKLKMMNL
jgi:hypothetical protein